MRYKILFICLGNICRSSAAEAVMREKLIEAGMSEQVMVDSAGLIDYHEGEPTDPRMRKHANRRGYTITHLSRPIRPADFEAFDMIIGMDDSNIQRLRRLAKNDEQRDKIHKMTEFCVDTHTNSVPDPYYGGAQDFELVLDLLDDTCGGLITYLQGILPPQ